MIFKRFRDILQFIETNENLDTSLKETKDYIKENLEKGFTFKELQFEQELNYGIDIFGTVRPILGEMVDTKTQRKDSLGRTVCNHIVTFLVKHNDDGSYLSPEGAIFTIDITPKTKTEYQRVKVTEILKL